jgi:hypothetical protein
MSPANLIRQAFIAGVALELSPLGNITVRGESSAVAELRSALTESKSEVVAKLLFQRWRTAVPFVLNAYPDVRVIIKVVDVTTDPVNVFIGIRDLATFAIRIPQATFSAHGLFEIAEKNSTGGDYAVAA